MKACLENLLNKYWFVCPAMNPSKQSGTLFVVLTPAETSLSIIKLLVESYPKDHVIIKSYFPIGSIGYNYSLV